MKGCLKFSKYQIPFFIMMLSSPCLASVEKIDYWINQEFRVSTLSKQQQVDEILWFVNAAKPYQGLTIRVVSEELKTHWYEANVLAKAFSDITGINVIHEITDEDDVIKKVIAQGQLNESIYDAYVTDSDLIGFYYRSNQIMPISEFIENDGKLVTLPTLDLDDFLGIEFVTAPNGVVYQLPTQQFANLYWFRYDWFNREELQVKFKKIYGYDLGVPKNWSAYEDIAEFFSFHVKEIDGVRIYGHMDYGKYDPSLGWRFSDSWLSMAGMGDKGLPNGLPVDDWGIRVENCHPVGASVARGGAINSPAAVYAVTKYLDWLEKYAPPEAKELDFLQAGSFLQKGNVAQQIFLYTTFLPDLLTPELLHSDGTPRWRVAPSPRGAYWQEGMKLGYQDVGAWTFFYNTPLANRQAAWLYAQFTVSKTVSLQKFLAGLTPIRESDITSSVLDSVSGKYGGLIEFYRSPARHIWTPTGVNVPHYPELSVLWWQNIGLIRNGSFSVKEGLDKLASEMDSKLKELGEKGLDRCQPKLNNISLESYWLKKEGSPKKKLDNEKIRPETLSYQDALLLWSVNDD